MFSLVFLCICCFGNLQGCAPGFKYISPNQATPGAQDTCRDCSRTLQTDMSEDGRFFTGLPCCSASSNKVGPWKMKNATECGRKGPAAADDNDKIIGGVPVLENEIPWQVALLNQGGSWRGCVAILLSCDPVIVITAAHCVTNPLKPEENPPTNNLTLGFGAHKVIIGKPSPIDKNEVRLEVEEIIVHPSFSLFTVHVGISLRNNLNLTGGENDIAVIKVKNGSALECKKKVIWPACLPNKDTDYAGWNRTILSGWGKVVGGENITTKPRTLKKTSLSIIGDQECAEFLADAGQVWSIDDKQLCARDRQGDSSGCQGDSGGPLVAEDIHSEGYSAVGIVSSGDGGCNTIFPNFYTEIGKYLDWIGRQFDLLPPE